MSTRSPKVPIDRVTSALGIGINFSSQSKRIGIYLFTSTRPSSPYQQHYVNVFRSDKVLILLSKPLEFASTKDELMAAAEDARLSLLLL